MNRPALSQLMSLASKHQSESVTDKCLSNADIRNGTSLGTVYVEAMPRYARGAGLFTEGNCLTEFGQFASENDPMLVRSGTQWLLHYYMCNTYGVAPLFWNEIIATRFRTGNSFFPEEITDQIHRFYTEDLGASASLKSANVTKTIFLGTYTKDDGLNTLSMLEAMPDGKYRVLEPNSVPTWVFAYALIDTWENHYAGRVSINLDELTNDRGLATLFLLDDSRLNRILSELQQAGFVDIYRTAQPYQLLLLSHDKTAALRNLYGLHPSV